MSKFWIQYGLGHPGEWEEIEAGTLEEADAEAYRLVMEQCESEIYYEAVDKMPEELK